jgi:endonuclease/exonuclease/phosphatase family metal-dependent hydrolase
MTIKVVSLNIWFGGLLQDKVMAFLEAQDADIVVLQEVFNGEDPTLAVQHRTVQVLKERLGLPYEKFAPEYRDYDQTGGKAQVGNAIFSRFPITSSTITAFIPYTEDYRDVPGNIHNCPCSLQHATLDTPVGKVNVFNIHGVWDLNGDNLSPLRQKMSNLVIDAIKDKKNVILAGDTNAKPTNKAMIAIEQHLKSVFGHELTTTFNMRHKDNPGYATAVVDMMFVSPNIQVIEHECPDVDVSDHMPLRATLEIN